MTTELDAAIERVKLVRDCEKTDARMTCLLFFYENGNNRRVEAVNKYAADLETIANAHIAYLEAEAERKRERYEWTREPPAKAGMYWMTYAGEDWDIALRMARIRQVEDSQGARTEIQVGFTWTNTRDDMFRDALWCGPMPNPGVPSLDLLAALRGMSR